VAPLLLTQDGQHLDHTELALSDVVQEFKSANVLALLVTLVEHHALDLTLDPVLVAAQLFTRDGQHSDHTVLALCLVVLEYK